MSLLREIKMLLPHRQLKLRRERKSQRATVEKAIQHINDAFPTSNDKAGLFIDCGFNTRHVFDLYYDALADRFDFIGFEIQPKLYNKAVAEISKYTKRNPQFLHSAVSDHVGAINYFEPKSWGLNYKGGATIVSEKNDRPSIEIPQKIPCIDFSDFLDQNTQDQPFVVVKMDIEGAEYQVMEKVIADGRLDKIDLLFIEFHSQYLQNTDESNWQERHSNLVNALEASKVQYFDWI